MSRTSYLRRPLTAVLIAAALAASVLMAAVMLASPAWAATYTVINTNDSGSGSLRQAINDANATTGVADTIDFAPSVSGQTITLATPLPITTDGAGLTIDGGSANITISGDKQHRVFEVGGPLTLSNLTVADGGGVRGNGIYNNGGTLEVSNSTLSGNSANGIANIYGTVTVSNSTLSDNSDAFVGGGIFNYFGTVTVSNSTLSGNSAPFDGGGISNYGTLEVSNSTLSGNSANGDAGVSPDGGGIHNNGGTVTVSNSTLSGNSANSDAGIGGGISNTNLGTVTVSNSTLSGNSVNGGAGGGIYNNSATLEVSNSTLSGNSANGDAGRSIYNNGGTATFKNTIVANSPSGGSCGGTITDGGYNLDSDNTCGFGTNNNSLSGVDPMLGPLADNGGPTMTHALLEGSPAIDNGVAVEGITTDQRGVARPQGGAPDIGSFEFEAPDTTAPSVSCSVSPNRLRTSANNHKLVTVTATVQVTDPGSGPGGFTLVSVTSNQEDSGLGTGDVPNDIQGWTIDDADTSGQLRAERYGGTRIYTLTYEGTDLAGNTKSCQATVTVPRG